MITKSKFFPNSSACIVHQNGMELSERTKGVTITLRYENGETEPPTVAELESGEHYAVIGLEWIGNELVDYDGVFDLPREVEEFLRESGYIVSGFN